MKSNFFSIFVSLLMIIVCSCNSDKSDVKIEGYIINSQTQEPIINDTIFIINYYYEGGDYDAFGNAGDVYRVVSDTNGYYSIFLEKSAYIQMDILNIKDIYPTSFFKEKYIGKKNNKINFYK